MIPEGQLASVNSGLLVPWLPGPPLYADSFRCNVRELLHLYGRKVPLNGLRRATAYIVELESPKGVTRLHVYEEKLDEKDGAVCDQCRCMGKLARRRSALQAFSRRHIWAAVGLGTVAGGWHLAHPSILESMLTLNYSKLTPPHADQQAPHADQQAPTYQSFSSQRASLPRSVSIRTVLSNEHQTPSLLLQAGSITLFATASIISSSPARQHWKTRSS